MIDDIRIKVSWRNHRKRIKLHKLLGLEGEVYWINLLLAVRENKPDGNLTNMDEYDIASDAGYSGDPKDFVNALIECKLLDKNKKFFKVHDWQEHNPYACHSKERSEKARKAAEIRWHKRNPHNATSMLTAMPQASASNAPSPTPSPYPNKLSKHRLACEECGIDFLKHPDMRVIGSKLCVTCGRYK